MEEGQQKKNKQKLPPDQIAEQKELIERLKRNDEEAWILLKENVVKKVLRTYVNGASLSSIMRDSLMEEDDLLNALYDMMIVKGKIENYGYYGTVFAFMRSYLRGYLIDKSKKILYPMSGNEEFLLSISEDHKETWELIEKCFTKLWRKNPMNAYVYFLRRFEALPSLKISPALGISACNTDQIFSRANREMMEMLKTEGGRG